MGRVSSGRLTPQRPRDVRAVVTSVEWVFEPSWSGERLLVRYHDGVQSVTGEGGEEVPAAVGDEVADVLRHAVLAGRALLDGVWTAQPFTGDGSAARAWAETLDEAGIADELPDPLETESRRAFVAVDLLELDGEELYDVPLQERRRILESVVDEGVRVRLSPMVKQPVAAWLIGWRANGFSHYLAKHQNSRYRPGEVSDEWLRIPVQHEAVPGFATRWFGVGGQRERRIED